ncbi:MAG: hypothetical protein K8R68_08660 [Bacteroidales bacterium]|nr:hypothetical protein [Bacteroidales bacterium]
MLETNKPEQKARPELLTVLCILTFIGSGLATFSNMFLYLSYEEVLNTMDEMNMNLPEFDLIMSGGRKFFLTGFILYIISLSGAFRMWRLRKIGFHLYTGAQIFILLLPVVLINNYQFSIISLILTATFIIAYASNLKFMS